MGLDRHIVRTLTLYRLKYELFVPGPDDHTTAVVSDEQALRFAVLTFRRVIKVGKQFEPGLGNGVAVDVFDERGHGGSVSIFALSLSETGDQNVRGGCSRSSRPMDDQSIVEVYSRSSIWSESSISPNNSPERRWWQALGFSESFTSKKPGSRSQGQGFQ